MKRGGFIAAVLVALLVALLVARAAAAQATDAGGTPGVAPPLDTFTAQYGYPTFPVTPAYDVPYIWNGPDYDTLRIGDLTMIPILNQAASSVPSAPSRPGFGFAFTHH